MRKTKEQKAITLIALIITIVVLLILALVTINAVRGDGIIGRAQQAKNEYAQAQAKEKVAIELENWRILKHTQADANLASFLAEKFGVENVATNQDGTYTITVDGYGVIVDAEGNITGITNGNTTGGNNEVPSITLEPTEINVEIEENKTTTATITAKLINAAGELNWTSSDDTIAEISGDANDTKTLTLKKEGNATITVSYDEYSATCNITVKKLVPQIGDKVAYDEGTGKTSSIDTNFVMKDMEWRILDIEDDGTIELISTQPTDSTLTLSGEDGYLNGIENLDTLCNDLYANGEGVTARNLKIDDIDKLAGIITDEDKKALDSDYGSLWRYRYDTTAGKIQYSKSIDNGVTWTDYADTSYTKFKEPGKSEINSTNNTDIAELKSTYYYYKIGDKVTEATTDGISMARLITEGLNNTNDAASGSYVTQWISSSFVKCSINRVGYYMFYGAGNYTYIWFTNGMGGSMTKELRPVVTLPSSVSLTKVDGVWQVNV